MQVQRQCFHCATGFTCFWGRHKFNVLLEAPVTPLSIWHTGVSNKYKHKIKCYENQVKRMSKLETILRSPWQIAGQLLLGTNHLYPPPIFLLSQNSMGHNGQLWSLHDATHWMSFATIMQCYSCIFFSKGWVALTMAAKFTILWVRTKTSPTHFTLFLFPISLNRINVELIAHGRLKGSVLAVSQLMCSH